MNRILDCLVLDWKDLDALYDLVEEELAEDVSRVATRTLLSREAEVDAVLHNKETLLALWTLKALKKLLVNLRHGPALDLSSPAFLVNEGIAKLGTDWNVSISELFKAHSVHLTVVLDKLSNNLELIVGTDVEIGLHPLNDWCVKVLWVDFKHDLEWEPFQDG